MSLSSLVVSLPIADRRTSFVFYREGLGFDALGESADDGVPEPLQFAVNDDVRLMLIPSRGFGRVIGDRAVAARGHSECALVLRVETEAAVAEMVDSAHQAGAEIVTGPGKQPWGYAGAFADPDGHVWLVSSDRFPTSP